MSEPVIDKDRASSASGTGPSQAEPEVSALRASVPDAGCSSCAHWGRTDRWEGIQAGFGACLRITEGWQIGDKAVSHLIYDGDRDVGYPGTPEYKPGAYTRARIHALQEAKAAVWDGSEYMAELLTAPDFGCRLWAAQGIEARSDETANAGSAVGESPVRKDAP